MLRRSLLVVVVALLASCSNCDSPCKSGITFYLSPLAGALAPGSEQDVKFCFDDQCSTATVTRDMVGGTLFLEYSGVSTGDHTITVSAEGSVSGTYTGPIEVSEQSGGSNCGTCKVGAIKVSADGTLTPGVATPTSTTVPATGG